jgi:hypothetical protein
VRIPPWKKKDDIALEREFDFEIILFRARNDTDGRAVFQSTFLVIQEVQIENDLDRVRGLELADLQIDGNQALGEAVEEEQVDEVVSLLPRMSHCCRPMK